MKHSLLRSAHTTAGEGYTPLRSNESPECRLWPRILPGLAKLERTTGALPSNASYRSPQRHCNSPHPRHARSHGHRRGRRRRLRRRPHHQPPGADRRRHLRPRSRHLRPHRHHGQPDRHPPPHPARPGGHLRVPCPHLRLGDGHDRRFLWLPGPHRLCASRNPHLAARSLRHRP